MGFWQLLLILDSNQLFCNFKIQAKAHGRSKTFPELSAKIH